MNTEPNAPTLDKTNRTSCEPRGTNDGRHFPQFHVGVGYHHTPARLHRGECIAGDNCVGVGKAGRVKSIGAIDHEMLIGFEMKVAVIARELRGESALSTARKTTQNNAIKSGQRGE